MTIISFARTTAVITVALACICVVQTRAFAAETVVKLSDHLSVYRGPINVGIIRDGDKALLIDCAEGGLRDSLADLGVKSVERIIFTHHHRDQALGARCLAAEGAKIGVPAAERDYFDKVQDYWNSSKSRWHIYNFHSHRLMLSEPLDVDETYADGQTFEWGPAKITAIATPGHTDGSLSYVVEIDGLLSIFSGDVIHDAGRVWDIHSLQKGINSGGRRLHDYHGFLGARGDLAGSLERIKKTGPDVLVPSHGEIMADPPAAIDLLLARLEECYDKYVAISALRHYFPWLFEEYAGRSGHMPIRPGKTPPACLRHFGTTWMVVSKDKTAFVMDCGKPTVIGEIQKLMKKGEISDVEGLWITHYHDDHVDAVPKFQETFDCPCYADVNVAPVLTNSLAWRLPCISPGVCRVDNVTTEGQSWQWREFRMTAYFLPGQTLYHGALLVEKDDMKMLFVGDSFTAAGIDDYCAYNRNWLGSDVGFDRCLTLVERIKPTHIFNCHVSDAFNFTAEEIQHMRTNLAEREKLFGQIVPWDHANYGMDDSWVRCFPYEQKSAPGKTIELDVILTNHSKIPNPASCRAVLPIAWKMEPSAWSKATIAAKTEGKLPLSFAVPVDAKPGRHVIPIDVRYGDRSLPQFTEAIVVVE